MGNSLMLSLLELSSSASGGASDSHDELSMSRLAVEKGRECRFEVRSSSSNSSEVVVLLGWMTDAMVCLEG